MKLKSEDAALFYELFFPLLDYVNESFHVTVEDVQFVGKRIDPRDADEFLLGAIITQKERHRKHRSFIYSITTYITVPSSYRSVNVTVGELQRI